MSNKVVLITGASNGMGFEAAKLFADKGWKVIAGARRVEKIPAVENITPVKVDVTNPTENKLFVDQAIEKYGRIDVLINNAGYGEYGPTEEIKTDDAKYQFDVNYFGAVELANMVLPIMRKQKNGIIINIGSIAGNLYMPLGAHYHASKAALQQWSDVLDSEVRQFGISSVVIQPGLTQSSWSEIAVANAIRNTSPGSEYQRLVDAVTKLVPNTSEIKTTSKDLALLFFKVANSKKPKIRYFNSWKERFIVMIARNHPRTFRFFLKKIVEDVLDKK
ncbi:SDR family NAD(P)-dependent oxidoreductase [[Acholeplasma] multilocale]|uniref:SDR family NAD(P)-dependent oxidoreductase n=1 Tax=[Acholeplasma] multilocale TaxID=264638 RepID=UPI000479778F|nr:SDR family NAD(P)-dependent oxidoreductase [[Acholeplasma] multilocale]